MSFSSSSHAQLPYSDYNYIIDIITRKFMFFSFSLFPLKNKTGAILLQNFCVVYN